MASRAPYAGTERKLILAFDVGTTYSGISYSILDPGRIPEIHPVTRFPAQVNIGGNAKVPTVIYYGQDGVPQLAGAETEGLEILTVESQWIKAEWFKLHLRPKTRTAASVSEHIPALPDGKSIVDVFADFLKYLNQCARSYIEETHVEGWSLLQSSNIEYILTHPNGWEGPQQTLMRRAAAQAGLISNTSGDWERISFITEGEASLSFCIEKGLMNDSMRRGNGVIIVDAGGGTLDISAYAQKAGSDKEFEEIAPAQCHFQGSVFVTRAAKKYLDDYLLGSRYYDDLDFMVEKFDKSTKLSFRNPQDPQYIKFGSARDKDPDLNIRAGQLKLQGTTLAKFFEPSIQCIVDAIIAQKELASKPISSVFLVGGFAASDYLYSQLQQRLKPLGLNLYRPDAHVNKAVPDGAIAGHLSHFVRARVARFTYGVRGGREYNVFNHGHSRYKSRAYKDPSGSLVIPGAFESILLKNTKVSETQEFHVKMCQEAYAKRKLEEVSSHIMYYRGNLANPEFIDDDPVNFHDIFTMRVNTSTLTKHLEAKKGPGDTTYYRANFSVVLLFGLTEFKALCTWKENGIEKRSRAEIIYDTEGGTEYEV